MDGIATRRVDTNPISKAVAVIGNQCVEASEIVRRGVRTGVMDSVTAEEANRSIGRVAYRLRQLQAEIGAVAAQLERETTRTSSAVYRSEVELLARQ